MSKNLKIAIIIVVVLVGLPLLVMFIGMGFSLFGVKTTGLGFKNSQVAYDMMSGTTASSDEAASLGEMMKTRNMVAAPAVDGSLNSKGGTGVDVSQLPDRMVIKTAVISMVVKKVPEAIKNIEDFAVQNGGFVVNSGVEENQYSGIPSGNITIRIPSDKFDKGISNVKNNSLKIKSENVTGQDVTEQYVDLDAQLKNLQATEKQFLEIMKQAYKIDDILAVQRELSNVRGQIERIQGQMKYLKQSADMSTITVYLSTHESELPVIQEDNEWDPVIIARAAVRNLIGMGRTVVNLLIWLVIFIPLWLLLWVIIRVIIRYIRRKFGKSNLNKK